MEVVCLCQEIRSTVRELEQRLRELLSGLQKIHTEPTPAKIALLTKQAQAQLPVMVSQSLPWPTLF